MGTQQGLQQLAGVKELKEWRLFEEGAYLIKSKKYLEWIISRCLTSVDFDIKYGFRPRFVQ